MYQNPHTHSHHQGYPHNDPNELSPEGRRRFRRFVKIALFVSATVCLLGLGAIGYVTYGVVNSEEAKLIANAARDTAQATASEMAEQAKSLKERQANGEGLSTGSKTEDVAITKELIKEGADIVKQVIQD